MLKKMTLDELKQKKKALEEDLRKGFFRILLVLILFMVAGFIVAEYGSTQNGYYIKIYLIAFATLLILSCLLAYFFDKRLVIKHGLQCFHCSHLWKGKLIDHLLKTGCCKKCGEKIVEDLEIHEMNIPVIRSYLKRNLSDKKIIYFMIQVGVVSCLSLFCFALIFTKGLGSEDSFIKLYVFNISLISTIGPTLWFVYLIVKILLVLFIMQLVFIATTLIQAVIMKRFLLKSEMEIIFGGGLKLLRDKIMFPIFGKYYERLLLRIIRNTKNKTLISE